MMKKNLNNFILVIFVIFGLNLNAIKISQIENANLLENYELIKNIDVERVVDENNYDRNEAGDRVYVHGETAAFTGLGVERQGSRILNLSFYINGKCEGEGYSYTINGKLLNIRKCENDELKWLKRYKENGTLEQEYKQIKGKIGIKTVYYSNNRIASKQNVTFAEKGNMLTYIKEGETTVYEKNGNLWGILNFKNDSAYGLPQKLFKNGKLKYEFISAAEVGEKLETMTYFKEYFDKSDKLKLDCDEVSSGEWHCKEYKKDGTLKNEFTSPTYKPKKDNSFWINAFLGIWNMLF